MEEENSLGDAGEFRLILVGKTGGGKSATGNTILGRPVFKSILAPQGTTLSCQRGQGRWQDRQISVVDTPAICDSEITSERVKNEIKACVQLSRPGPHALIFVTQVGRFTAEDAAAAKRVWDIFGAESAGHTVVVFTCKEDLGGGSLQEYVQKSDNRNLRGLIRRCGNRFCGFNNKAAGAERERQVTELMEMVQSVSANGRKHYVIREVPVGGQHARTPLQDRKDRERASEGYSKKTRKSRVLCCAMCLEMAGGIRGPERRIVLIGIAGNGKSATGNTILGSPVFECSSATRSFQKEETWLKGRKIVVLDTPSFVDTALFGWHFLNFNHIVSNITKSVRICSPGPHVILWVMHPLRFIRENQEIAQLIQQKFSREDTNYMIILFTHKEDLEGKTPERFISEGDPSLRDLVSQCGNRVLAFDNRAEGEEREAQVAQLMTMIDDLVKEHKDAPCYTEDMIKADAENQQK